MVSIIDGDTKNFNTKLLLGILGLFIFPISIIAVLTLTKEEKIEREKNKVLRQIEPGKNREVNNQMLNVFW